MKRCVPLEDAAEAVCNQNSVPPLIFQMPPEQGRRVLEEAQDAPVYKYPADIFSDCIDTGKWGSIPVYFIVKRKPPAMLAVPKSFSYGQEKVSSFGVIEKVCQPLQKPKEESSPDET